MAISKLHIRTFGCQMNEYDSNKMSDVLNASHGLNLTEDISEADVLLINTCSIREKAEDKLFHQLGRWRKLKEKNPNLVIGVGGCVASQEGDLILKRAPYVDMIFGPQTLHRLPNMLNDALNQHEISIDISFPEIEKFDHLPEPHSNGASAFVSIMEGCSKYCTFCVVPYTRGEEISRPLDDIITEIIQLTLQGASEIILLGQNVNGYRGLMSNGKIANFASLIEYISEIEEVKRIRFTTSHPNEMNDHLIDCFGNIKKLANHLHLPIQSGSDKVLMAMKRNYTTLEYKSIIKKLRKKLPNVSLTTDLIIGFPTETTNDFNLTKKLFIELDFDYSFSFIYSKRPGTPAAYLKDETTNEEKLERLHEIQSINVTQGESYTKKMIGTTQRVLIDHFSKKKPGVLLGKTDNNRIIEFKESKDLLNKFVNVKVMEILGKSLVGELV